jgi:hypothetical protein
MSTITHPTLSFAGEIRCHGDSLTDRLRVARMRLARTAADVENVAASVRVLAEAGVEIGYVAETMVEHIEDGALEEMDSRRLKSRAYNLRADIDEADDYDNIPERDAHEALKKLAKALDEHALAIDELRKAEKFRLKHP